MDNNAVKEIASMVGLIDTYKRWVNYKSKQNKERKYISYHPSEWGHCLRAQQYKHYAELGLIEVEYFEIPSKRLRLFDHGHNMHSRWVRYFRQIGILRGRWQCQNPLCFLSNEDGTLKNNLNSKLIEEILEKGEKRIYGEKNLQGVFQPSKCKCGYTKFRYLETGVRDKILNMKGNADLILDCSNLNPNKFEGVRRTFDSRFLPAAGEKVVGEMKSIGSNPWNYQLEKKGPYMAHLIQVNIYIHILDCDYGFLIYENKDNSEIEIHKIDRNKEWWETIKWQAKKMQEMVSNRQLPPPKPASKMSHDCKSCDFKSICHKSKIWTDSQLLKKRKNFYGVFL